MRWLRARVFRLECLSSKSVHSETRAGYVVPGALELFLRMSVCVPVYRPLPVKKKNEIKISAEKISKIISENTQVYLQVQSYMWDESVFHLPQLEVTVRRWFAREKLENQRSARYLYLQFVCFRFVFGFANSKWRAHYFNSINDRLLCGPLLENPHNLF